MLTTDFQYLNHDLAEHRLLLAEKSWDREKALIIFDELHKMHEWKSWLKGIYDVEGIPPGLMVTGSAGLDAFRKVGDSLAGGHFQIRLHPIDLKEALAYLQAKSEATPCPPMPLKTESKKIGRGIEGHERARRWSHGGPMVVPWWSQIYIRKLAASPRPQCLPGASGNLYSLQAIDLVA